MGQQIDQSQQQLVPAVSHPVELLGESAAAAADTSIAAAAYGRHVHLHMHMHAMPVLPPAMCSMNVAIANNPPAHAQQHQLPGHQTWTTAQDLHTSSVSSSHASLKQQKQQQQEFTKTQHFTGFEAAEAVLPVQQNRRQRRSRLRRVLRTMAITGAATAVALAGAGLAAAALAPRMELLETSYQEVCLHTLHVSQCS